MHDRILHALSLVALALSFCALLLCLVACRGTLYDDSGSSGLKVGTWDSCEANPCAAPCQVPTP